jgi:hypothetical protein
MLAGYGGALIATGALFSVLLSGGVETPGPRRLLEGLGVLRRFFLCDPVACYLVHRSKRGHASGGVLSHNVLTRMESKTSAVEVLIL